MGPSVALVHDWLTGMRGGERCLEVLCELFPDAPLFTLLHVPGSVSSQIERRRIVTSFVQRLPNASERYRHYLPTFPLAIRRFDLSGYDLVVSMSHCVAKGVRVAPRALHLCYCFSPMRYIWDLSSDYFGPGQSLAARTLGPPLAAALRRWDRNTGGVHRFVAISRHIADRIRCPYGPPADVLYPPVGVRLRRAAPRSGRALAADPSRGGAAVPPGDRATACPRARDDGGTRRLRRGAVGRVLPGAVGRGARRGDRTVRGR